MTSTAALYSTMTGKAASYLNSLTGTVVSLYDMTGMAAKVATDRLEYRAEPKEPAQFGSVSGSEIQNLPFSISGIVSLYRPEPKEPAKTDRYLVRRYKTFVSVATLVALGINIMQG